MEDEKQTNGRSSKVIAWIVALPFLYMLSSGPILATAFWLRERTHWDGFYAAMWLYYPLFLLRDTPLDDPIDKYLTWWVNLFGTVGPG